ncbi:MAG: site-2 protease family protein [Candidatus Kryptoniota bacterium]
MLDDLYVLPVLLFSVIIHEISHGYVALRMGDPTAKESGRLTLNPIPHIDLFGSILVPLFSLLTVGHILIAWAKPVPVNPNNFNDEKRGEIFVSSVGPISNLIMAVICSITTIFILKLQPVFGTSNMGKAFFEFLLKMFFGGISLNIILAIFNLIPIPPLDGSHVIKPFLPLSVAESYEHIGFFGVFLILILMRVPAFQATFNAVINFFYIPLYRFVLNFA